MDREYVKNIITKIERAKQEKNMSPDYALMESIKASVMDDLVQTLREMCIDNTIEWHKTLNSVGFKVKENRDE